MVGREELEVEVDIEIEVGRGGTETGTNAAGEGNSARFRAVLGVTLRSGEDVLEEEEDSSLLLPLSLLLLRSSPLAPGSGDGLCDRGGVVAPAEAMLMFWAA